jgi:hypothetical protein
VQHREFTAYHLHRAIGAVVLCLFSSEKRVFFKPFALHFFRKKEVRRDSFARCAYLPPELARHMYTVRQ